MMKWMLVMLPCVVLAGPVYQPHDKYPMHRMHDASDDNECNENHHLKPDGDGDCDDKARSVPEDTSSWASLVLLGLSAGYIMVRYRRRSDLSAAHRRKPA
jgi:hypothetical protein